jgi:hypothetical protein
MFDRLYTVYKRIRENDKRLNIHTRRLGLLPISSYIYIYIHKEYIV